MESWFNDYQLERTKQTVPFQSPWNNTEYKKQVDFVIYIVTYIVSIFLREFTFYPILIIHPFHSCIQHEVSRNVFPPYEELSVFFIVSSSNSTGTHRFYGCPQNMSNFLLSIIKTDDNLVDLRLKKKNRKKNSVKRRETKSNFWSSNKCYALPRQNSTQQKGKRVIIQRPSIVNNECSFSGEKVHPRSWFISGGTSVIIMLFVFNIILMKQFNQGKLPRSNFITLQWIFWRLLINYIYVEQCIFHYSISILTIGTRRRSHCSSNRKTTG